MAGLVYVCISDIVTNIPKVARRLAALHCPISPISVLINLLIISAGQDASGVRSEIVHQAPEETTSWAVCAFHGSHSIFYIFYIKLWEPQYSRAWRRFPKKHECSTKC